MGQVSRFQRVLVGDAAHTALLLRPSRPVPQEEHVSHPCFVDAASCATMLPHDCVVVAAVVCYVTSCT